MLHIRHRPIVNNAGRSRMAREFRFSREGDPVRHSLEKGQEMTTVGFVEGTTRCVRPLPLPHAHLSH